MRRYRAGTAAALLAAVATLTATMAGPPPAAATVLVEQVLTAPQPRDLGRFGELLDADGGRLVVVEGGPRTVHVVERTALGWEVVRSVRVPTGLFLQDVAVSGDLAVVGATGPEGLGDPDGEVWLLDAARGGTPTRLAVPVVAGGARDAIGSSVALDGDTLVVGAPGTSRVYVFSRAGDSWALAPGGVLTKPQASVRELGRAVAVAGDWVMAAEGSQQFGRVHAYRRSGGSWSYSSTLRDQSGEIDFSAADDGGELAMDGDVAVVVGHEDPGIGDATFGTVFVRATTGWTARAALPGSPSIFSRVGVTVEGGRIAVLDDAGSGPVVHVHQRVAPWRKVDTAEVDAGTSGLAVALVGPTLAVGVDAASTGTTSGGVVRMLGVHPTVAASPFESLDPHGDGSGGGDTDLIATGLRYAGPQVTVTARAAAPDNPLTSRRWLDGDVALLFRFDGRVEPLLYQVNPSWRGLVGSDLVARFEEDPGRRCGVATPVWAASYSAGTWTATFPAACLGAPPSTAFSVEFVDRFLATLDDTEPSPAVTRGPLVGYWVAAADGSVAAFGDVSGHGDLAGRPHHPVVAIAAPPALHGYWLVERDGTVARFGGAQAYGGVDHLPLAAPIVHAASTPTGDGYWLLGADGGVFALGDARFHGSTGGLPLVRPVVAMAADPVAGGYWLVAADGGVFTFGRGTRFHGSLPAIVPVERLAAPIVGVARTATGGGYWLVAEDGGVFAFGDARFHGSVPDVLGGRPLAAPIVGIVATPSGRGYWVVGADGGVFAFGDAPFLGSLAGTGRQVVSLAG